MRPARSRKRPTSRSAQPRWSRPERVKGELRPAGRVACGVGLLGLGMGLYARHAKALPPAAIRPPGALAESEFSAACIRCGMCVRDCPYDILHLAKPEEPMSTGTPYFVARQAPCEMCEDIPCIKACPTGAL